MGYLLKKKLLSSWDKPAFDLLIRSKLRMRCLFDTGADTPDDSKGAPKKAKQLLKKKDERKV